MGQTKIKSVSVSDEFSDIIKQYNLSPTEVFRRGLAVMLYDLGVEQYKTETNEKRKKFVDEFLKDEEKIKLFKNLIEFSQEVIKFNEELKENGS